jgi:uncharacterized protein
MKKGVLLNVIFTLILLASGSLFAYSQDIPDKQNPPRLVNDFAGLLTAGEINSLEHKLVLFNDSTSTQIAIVIVKDLKGYSKSDYAQRLAEKWGVGQKGRNNGLLILVKPKTADSNGEVQIATGYGAEGAVPDLLCSDIVNNEILPDFRQNNYYGGLDKATSAIISLIRGEYTAEQYAKDNKKNVRKNAPIAIIIIIVIIVMFLKNSGRNNHSNLGGSGLPFWVLLGMMNSGSNSHSGSWGGFSGGGSSGGFGGFGGGSFGGGGAGGSW